MPVTVPPEMMAAEGVPEVQVCATVILPLSSTTAVSLTANDGTGWFKKSL